MARMTSLALTLGILGATSLTRSVAAEPKVLGLEFNKVAARDPVLIESGTRLDRRASTVSATLSNAQADTLYLINVTIGTPPQNFQLQLDTGSSDVWVPSTALSLCSGRSNPCTNGVFDSSKSSSFSDLLKNGFEIQYVDGTQIEGDYFSDVLGVSGSSIKNMTMGLATQQSSQGSSGTVFQGIVGVGFQSGEAIASQQQGRTYPSFVSMLKSTGLINTEAYSLWLNDLDATTGSILFGGVDTAKYHGDLAILPIQPDSQSNSITSFTVVLDNLEVIGGGNSTQYQKTSLAAPVILDSGTTLTYLPDQIANDIATGVGATNSRDYGLVVPCSIAKTPATINFGFGAANGVTIVAPIGQFVIPFPAGAPAPKYKSNGDTACFWGINPAGSDPNLLGDTFLRSAYVVYNLDGQQIGLAQTNFNATSSNVQDISQTSSVPNAATTVSGAAVTQTATGDSFPSGLAPYLTNSAAATSVTQGTGTFNLGPTSTSGGKKSAANAVQIPSFTYSAILVAYPAALVVFGAVIAVL